VEISFLKAGKQTFAAGVLMLFAGFACADLAFAQAAGQAAGQSSGQSAGQAGGQGGQAAPQKNYKDRGEYDLYSKITQTTDPKARLDLLNQWQDKYPQSDFAEDRAQAFVATLAQLAPNDPAARQQLIQKCQDLLKVDPKNFAGLYYLTLFGPQLGGATPQGDLSTQVQNAAKGLLDSVDTMFAPDKKKPNMSDADWAKAKNAVVAIAHNALAWAATANATNKDTATAENEYKASLEANPDQGTVSAVYGKLLIDEKKYPEGLFEYARAGEYAGPGPAVAPDARPKLLDYFNKVYKDYHGSADGADQILAQAKTSALPPADLKITSQADIANQQNQALEQRFTSDPQFKIWYGIKQNLTGDNGQQVFEQNVKDAEIPGGAEGVKNFTGTVISIDPPDKPTKVVLGVEDPAKPDATLEFSQPLPAEALDKIKVGQKLDFSGVADSYNKDPYMLTFKDPTIPGVQTTAPPRKATRRRK
jgi:hypothetical protein